MEYTSWLKARPEVLSVYLCGSWAKGTYTPYSDVDLLLVLDQSRYAKPHERVPTYLPDCFPTGLDLFIYTAEELQANPWAQKLLQDAIQL